MEKQKQTLTTIAALAAAYFVVGKLGLALALVNPSASAVWPPAGISLAAFLLLGEDVWPGIWLGAFLVNLTIVHSTVVCAGIATGNTLEGLVGAYLVNRFAGGRGAMGRTEDILKFAVLAGLLSTMVSATIGAGSLTLGGFAGPAGFGTIWRTWWLGDAVGDVTVAPFLIFWISNPRLRWRRSQYLEAALLLPSLILASLVVFDGFIISGSGRYPLEYFCVPFLIWAAFRFGQREAATATLILSGVAIWGTLHGFGPFAGESLNTSLLFLQTFVGIVAVLTTAYAAEFMERQRAEGQAQFLTASDPLTGLGNYRKLFDTLETEIARSIRSEQPFAFLLMDLDGLEQINATHGHRVGNRALCRLANVLRLNCRETDLPARHGGDEFALIISEAGAAEARQVVRRISQRLAEDGELPTLSVSVGAAVFPDDGDSTLTLLQAADHALHSVKQQAEQRRDMLESSDPNRRTSE